MVAVILRNNVEINIEINIEIKFTITFSYCLFFIYELFALQKKSTQS